jgi:UvrD/REP helicase N-terminal domain
MSVVIEDFTEAYRAGLGRHAHAFYSNWEAVVGAGGPSLLVIDGAGAGKTAMLAHRVAALILGGADSKRIMLATFSRQAAADVNRRVERIVARRLPPEAASAAIPAWSGAFHAIGARLLREYAGRIGLDPPFAIHDREEKAPGMPLRKPRRPRPPSLTTRLQQIWKAARAVGVEVAVTIEGDKLTATPVRGNALGEPERDNPFANPWDQVYAANKKRPS